MTLFSLLILAAGLSMDAFAVSVCKGLAVKKSPLRTALVCGIWFGLFQSLMTATGFLLGSQFKSFITAVDHWIVFVLLAVIGGNMIRESRSSDAEADDSLSFRTMLILAIATSIDALAVGITFAFFDVNIIVAVLLIGSITFCFSAAGVKIGAVFGVRYKSRAEITGGCILILLGLKILLEHLALLPALF